MRRIVLVVLSSLLCLACSSPPVKPRPVRSATEIQLLLKMQKQGVALVLDPCNVLDNIGQDDILPAVQLRERRAIVASISPRFEQLGIKIAQVRSPYYCASLAIADSPASLGGNGQFKPLLGEPQSIKADPTLRQAWMEVMQQINASYKCPTLERGCGEENADASFISEKSAARIKKSLGVSLLWGMTTAAYTPSTAKNAVVKTTEVITNVFMLLAAGLAGSNNNDYENFSAEDTRIFTQVAVIDLDTRKVVWVRPRFRTISKKNEGYFNDDWAAYTARMVLD